jgi:hypothetical protein
MFTQSCFIKKNTPELKKKLEELGYKYSTVCGIKSNNIVVSLGCIFDIYPVDTIKRGFNNCIDCEANEKLFLALAALRDDNDYMQWFISDKTKQFYKCTSNKFDWQQEEIANWLCCISVEYFRKATVEEIIENFKSKYIC